jgi:hypothetical protein
MRAAVVATVVLAGIVAGCGGGSGAEGARDATTSFIDAIRARDGKRACSYLTENGRSIYSQLGDTPCEQGILAAQFPPGAKVGKATVKGDTARVPLLASGAPPVIVVLKKQDGSWRIDMSG